MTTAPADRVIVSIDDGVADVRLNRPDKMNALDPAMFDALIAVGEALASDPTVRVVVISGNGRSFCAGLDVEWFHAMADAGSGKRDETTSRFAQREGRPSNRGQHAVHLWCAMPAPVIAAIHGVAVGGGFDLSLAADIRIVAPDATLGSFEIRWGMLPDLTGSVMLPRATSLDVAKLRALTGRSITGAEAVRLGVATLLSEDPHSQALAVAREIADRNPDAVVRAKALLNHVVRCTIAEGIDAEHQLLEEIVGQPNQIEAINGAMENRRPRFESVDRNPIRWSPQAVHPA